MQTHTYQTAQQRRETMKAKPFPARYPGVCAATGQRYYPGALIQRGAKGWELADYPEEPAVETYASRGWDDETETVASVQPETEWSEHDPYDEPDFDPYHD